MIIGFTGHRSPLVGGYKIPNPTYSFIKTSIRKKLLELKPDCCITGMALGVDQYAAEVCMEMEIPFIAAVPFKDQDKIWPEESRRRYHELLGKASQIKIVSDGGYGKEKLQIRNEWIVNNSNLLIAVYNGDPSGGTFNCIRYAKSINKEIIIINPNELRIT